MTDTPAYRSPYSLLPMIGIPVFLAIANQTMISVALPGIGADLGQLRQLPWLVTGFMIAVTVAGPVYGMLGDTYGRARMLQNALVVYILGSLACAFAGDMTTLLLGRVLQGLGGGGLMSLSQALIGDAVEPRQRGRAQGNISMMSVLASTSGPLMAGFLIEWFGWRSMFLVTIPLAMLAMGLLARGQFAAVSAQRRRFDLPGFVSLLALVIGATVFIEAATHADTRAFAIPAALLAVAGLVGLVTSQPRATAPLLPPVLFTIPAIRRALVMVTCHGAALTALVTLIPLFHAILRSDGALDTAWSMLALTVAFGIAGFVTGNLITITGRTMLFPSITLLIAGSGVMILALFGEGLPRSALMAVYLLTGLSIGTVMAVVHTVVQQAAPEDLRGRAAGAITFFRSIGAVLGVALTSAVLFAVAPNQPGTDAGALLSGTMDIAPDTLEGWRTAFVAAFGTIAFFIVCGWTMALRNPLRRLD